MNKPLFGSGTLRAPDWERASICQTVESASLVRLPVPGRHKRDRHSLYRCVRESCTDQYIVLIILPVAAIEDQHTSIMKGAWAVLLLFPLASCVNTGDEPYATSVDGRFYVFADRVGPVPFSNRPEDSCNRALYALNH